MNHPRVSHTQEELENLAEDESPKLSSASFSCSLELELHASAIILLNYVHTNERSINVMLRPFEWRDERAPFLVLLRGILFQNLLGLLPCWGENPVGEMEASTQEIERDMRLLSKKFNDI